MEMTQQVFTIIQYMEGAFIFLIVLILIAVFLMFVLDISQTRHAIRRNFPVVGRFRYWFEHMREFFRQYFFALDREEMPFNRAERSWVYRAAKSVNNTVAFGSSRDLKPVGTALFVNCPYPTLDEDSTPTAAVTIGPYCEKPYKTNALFNISGKRVAIS